MDRQVWDVASSATPGSKNHRVDEPYRRADVDGDAWMGGQGDGQGGGSGPRAHDGVGNAGPDPLVGQGGGVGGL